MVNSYYRRQSTLSSFRGFLTTNIHFRSTSNYSSIALTNKYDNHDTKGVLNILFSDFNQCIHSSTSNRFFFTSKSNATANQKRLRNRKIILSKENWEKVFMEIDNDDDWISGKINTKQNDINHSITGNENGSILTYQVEDHIDPKGNFHSKHENDRFMVQDALCIESLLKDAYMLINKVKNDSKNTTWTQDDYIKVISLLKKITLSMKENEKYKQDIFIPFLGLNTDTDVNQHVEGDNETMDKPKYPWMYPNFKSLHSLNKIKHQQQQNEAIRTCVELIHLCISSQSQSSPSSSSMSVPHNLGMDMMDIIVFLVKEWPQISKISSSNNQKNNTSYQKNFLSADSLQYLGNIYISLLKSINMNDIETTANIEPDTITIENKRQIILNKSEALSSKTLLSLYTKESSLPLKYQNDIKTLHKALINAWTNSTAINMPTVSSEKNQKHENQDYSSFYHSAENATYHINCLVNDWNEIPSVQIYSNVLYSWSNLLRKKSKLIHQQLRRKNILSSSKSFANKLNHDEINFNRSESSYHIWEDDNKNLHETKIQNEKIFRDFLAAKCAQDLFHQIKKHLDKQVNPNESLNDLDSKEQNRGDYNIDIGIYDSILSNWANVTSIAVNSLPFSRKKTNNEENFSSLLNQAAEMAQNFFDEMNNESNNFKEKIKPNHTMYKAVLITWMNNSNGVKADAVLKQLEEDGRIEPNISCYRMVINAYKQNLNNEKELPEQLENLLTRAELNAKKVLSKRNLSFHYSITDFVPNEIFYSSVIHAWAHYKAETEDEMMFAAERAEAVLKRMKKMHADKLILDPPTVFCYIGVIAAWRKNTVHGCNKCISILNDMIESHLLQKTPKNHHERKAVTIAFTTVLGSLGKNEDKSNDIQVMDSIMEHLNNMQDLGWIKPDLIIMASIVDAMKRTGNGDITITKEIEDLLRGMQIKYISSGNNKLKPNIKTLNSSLDAWVQCSMKQPESRTVACERVFALLEWAELLYQNDENRNMRPGVRQYNILISMLAKDNTNEKSYVKIDELMAYMEELQGQDCELPLSNLNEEKERIGRSVIRPDAYTYYLAIEALKSNIFISHIEKIKKAKEYLLRMIQQFKVELHDENTRRKMMSMSTMISCIGLAIELCFLESKEIENDEEVRESVNDLVELFYSESGPEMPLKVLDTKIYESIINAHIKLFSKTHLKNDAINKVFEHCNANKLFTTSFVEKLKNGQRDDDDHLELFNTLARKYL